jgi:hypothetical protein
VEIVLSGPVPTLGDVKSRQPILEGLQGKAAKREGDVGYAEAPRGEIIGAESPMRLARLRLQTAAGILKMATMTALMGHAGAVTMARIFTV